MNADAINLEYNLGSTNLIIRGLRQIRPKYKKYYNSDEKFVFGWDPKPKDASYRVVLPSGKVISPGYILPLGSVGIINTREPDFHILVDATNPNKTIPDVYNLGRDWRKIGKIEETTPIRNNQTTLHEYIKDLVKDLEKIPISPI